MADEAVQNIYDEIEIDDMDFDEGKFYYPCPCGDKFQITLVSIINLFHIGPLSSNQNLSKLGS